MNIIEKVHEKINYKYQDSFDAPIIFDNKLIRSGKKDHIWLYAKEWEYKGNSYQEIDFGSWKFGDKENVKSWNADDIGSDKNFQKAYKKKTLESSAKVEMDKQRRQKECREKWSKILKSCENATEHDYLNFKGVDPYGLKIDKNGVLIVPCKDQNGITGAQRIYKDPETGDFTKRFSSGIKIQGSIHALSPLKNKSMCYLSEGYATASSVQMAFKEIPSVCCFNASNISHAIETIRSIYPDIKICIAADDDRSLKDNVGVRYAKQAARRYKEVIYRIPDFAVRNPSWTDFNDLHQFDSMESLIDQLHVAEDEFSYIRPLGYNESNYFYISSENKQIVSLNFNHHNKVGLRRLIANSSYWLKRYGVIDEEEIKMNWDAACEDLMYQCHKKGIFDPTKVRGIGVWKDGNKYCINDGDSVYNENENSEYQYQKTVRINYELGNHDQESMLHMLEGFKNLQYKNENDFFFLAAYAVQAQIFAVLPWRFHIWISGAAGTGKSTILKWLHDLSMNSRLTNNTTGAGIRQSLKSNATAVIYDEAEPTTNRTKEVIELAREMSSNGSYQVMRGTVSGNSINYNTQCIFCFGSIQVYNLNQADRSRIFMIEMDIIKDQTEEAFADISARMEHFIQYKNDFFTTVYKNIENIIHNTKICNRVLKQSHKLESRLADQLSVAMACFYVYFSSEKITEEVADVIIKKFNLVNSEYTTQNNEKEHESCYDALMEVIIDNYNNLTVAEAIHLIKYEQNTENLVQVEKVMGIHGLKYEKTSNLMFIHSKNSHLQGKIKDYTDYTRVLSRDKEIFHKKDVRKKITQLGFVRGITIRVK